TSIFVRPIERQRTEVRRRPEQDDGDEKKGLEREGTARREPANQRRSCAGGAADDGVLRGAALEPHRVDDNVKEDSRREQRRGRNISRNREDKDGGRRQDEAKHQRFAPRQAATRDRA